MKASVKAALERENPDFLTLHPGNLEIQVPRFSDFLRLSKRNMEFTNPHVTVHDARHWSELKHGIYNFVQSTHLGLPKFDHNQVTLIDMANSFEIEFDNRSRASQPRITLNDHNEVVLDDAEEHKSGYG